GRMGIHLQQQRGSLGTPGDRGEGMASRIPTHGIGQVIPVHALGFACRPRGGHTRRRRLRPGMGALYRCRRLISLQPRLTDAMELAVLVLPWLIDTFASWRMPLP